MKAKVITAEELKKRLLTDIDAEFRIIDFSQSKIFSPWVEPVCFTINAIEKGCLIVELENES